MSNRLAPLRATAYFSLQRHGSAQDDFDKVLSLTSNVYTHESVISLQLEHFYHSILTHIIRLSYFVLQASPASMKQCLHYDPDSKICLGLHRMVKSLDKGFRN